MAKDTRPAYKKLTNISAAITAAAGVASIIWPQYAKVAYGILAIVAPLLGVGIARRVTRVSENSSL